MSVLGAVAGAVIGAFLYHRGRKQSSAPKLSGAMPAAGSSKPTSPTSSPKSSHKYGKFRSVKKISYVDASVAIPVSQIECGTPNIVTDEPATPTNTVECRRSIKAAKKGKGRRSISATRKGRRRSRSRSVTNTTGNTADEVAAAAAAVV